MTKQRRNELLKRFHPDVVGSNRYRWLLERVVSTYNHAKHRYKKCVCGVTIASKSRHCFACKLRANAGGIAALSACLFLLAFSAQAEPGDVKLAWDASTTAGVQYRLYAAPFTLTSTNLPLAMVKLDAGTNLTATVRALAAGTWHFVATAYETNSIESLPSNPVTVQVPVPPPNMRTVVLQWNATVSGTNWLETGFFRVKFGDE